jgi:hypothetical protein
VTNRQSFSSDGNCCLAIPVLVSRSSEGHVFQLKMDEKIENCIFAGSICVNEKSDLLAVILGLDRR